MAGDGDQLSQTIEENQRHLDRYLQALSEPESAEPSYGGVGKVVLEVVRHMVTEEAVLLPAVRRAAPAGEELSTRALADHAQIEGMARRFETVDAAHPDYADALRELTEAVSVHGRWVHGELLTALSQQLSDDELAGLGAQLTPTMQSGPTQSHPTTPDSGLDVAHPGPGFVDSCREHLTAARMAGG